MGGFHIIKIITSFCVTFKGAFEQKPQFSCCENYQNPFAEKNYYVHIGLTQQPPPKVESVQFIGHEMLWQHRTIWQEHSAKDFASYESYKRAGILYVFPPFITARMGQKIGRRPQTQLCGDALSNLKVFLTGTFHGRCALLQSYLDEYCFRFNRRRTPDQLFARLARAVAVSAVAD